MYKTVYEAKYALYKLLELKPNWDGYNSQPPELRTVFITSTWLYKIYLKGYLPTQFFPMVDELGISILYEGINHIKIDIDCYIDRHTLFSIRKPDGSYVIGEIKNLEDEYSLYEDLNQHLIKYWDIK